MPQAAAIAPMVIGGVGLADQLFGSGRQARDQQSEALALQRQLANAQLPDIQRRSALNQALQDALMQIFQQGNEGGDIPDFLNLSRFHGGKFDQDLYSSLAPGIQRMNALKMLFGLGGDTGTGGIMGNAQLATGIGESRRSEFGDAVSRIVEGLAIQRMMNQKEYGPPAFGPENPLFDQFLGLTPSQINLPDYIPTFDAG